MERKIETFFQKWKNDIIRKPLILYGPKQVGKTFSVLNLGKTEYKNTVYFATDNNQELKDIFYSQVNDKVFCFIYACTDEFHQLFIAGRSGEFMDVMIDTMGVLNGALLALLIIKIISSSFSNKLSLKDGA